MNYDTDKPFWIINIRDVFLFLCVLITTYIGVAIVRGTFTYSILQGTGFLAILICFIFARLITYGESTVSPLLRWWYLFVITVVISMLINNDIKNAFNILMLWLSLYIMRRISARTIWIILISTVVAYIPMGLLFARDGTTNSNAVSFSFVFLVLLFFFASKKVHWIILVAFIGISAVMLMMLDSRTAFIAFGVCSLLFLFMYIHMTNEIHFKQLAVLVIIVVLLVIAVKEYDYLIAFVRDKWTSQGYDVDITTHRAEIWINEIMHHWTIWGGGSSYFMNTYHHGDGHNIFIQVLGRYGCVSLVFFICAVFCTMKCSFKIIKCEKTIFIPIGLLFCFLIGMFENVLFVDQKMYIPCVVFVLLIGLLEKSICNNREEVSI